ncbi:MAG: hypothetical protein PGN27_16885 [Mycolicibacterium neoaurum]|uniref:hypothetical protein n=1 Tax=Mycolicibacterium neoaurum TaxID=1795 RepID=UPI002FF49D51
MTCNSHVVWCSHRNVDVKEGRHDDYMACCHKNVGSSVLTVPEPGYDKAQVWVYATRTAHPDALETGVTPGQDAFDGIVVMLEQRHEVGTEKTWEDERPALRLASSEARTLAALLLRAADVEQGLTL